MKNLILILTLFMVLSSGCALLESGAKATFDIAWSAGTAVVKSQIPILKQEILDGAKAMADEGLDKAMVYTAEKTAGMADASLASLLAMLNVNIWDFDINGDGELSEVEKAMALNAAKEQDDQPWYAGALLALATLAFTGGKSINRWLAGKRDKEVTAKVEEVIDV